nr:hypothetical protein [Tanacetum cinerariifolium]
MFFLSSPTGRPPVAAGQPLPATTPPPAENFSGGLFTANPKRILTFRSTISLAPTRYPAVPPPPLPPQRHSRHSHHCCLTIAAIPPLVPSHHDTTITTVVPHHHQQPRLRFALRLICAFPAIVLHHRCYYIASGALGAFESRE